MKVSFISQEKYAADMLKKFRMENCKSAATTMALNERLMFDDGAEKFDPSIYRSFVGSFIYLTHERPDISHVVSLISRFMSNPSKSHFAAAKRIIRYIQGTKHLGIKYSREENNELLGFRDSDWAESQDDRKRTSGFIFCFGSKSILWSSKKQISVAMSSVEADYIAVNEEV
ncbi:secreted RxLR effector protein 161-like [Andrographis paniculata]|uniref:secreted RxLR effector protein 161-like n=1 Tax=Andrographis paniculata TaxID=175694 RepID=UPI0021E975B6|nr:secreted RxLR effector protein 161-like [Andrographis paniculata]